ncbi:hypothetical protein [Lentzea cavernae]|uniref:Uncharacterized protein n=1 Tax=Lentzea cavernae TaxID=2020703 RepID=A0ABQ3MT46_9PSEU|nr:hypothetical protein [Lentzea cavernae]GHH59702.1 hypothetical protein GCM10017774_82920 [Lentzea cavernae]
MTAPSEWMTQWAPVVSPVVTSAAVLVALAFGVREQFWRAGDRRRARWQNARSVTGKLAVLEEAGRFNVQRVEIWNAGSLPILDVEMRVIDANGKRYLIMDDDGEPCDYLYRAVIAEHEVHKREKITCIVPRDGAVSLDEQVHLVVTWRDPSDHWWTYFAQPRRWFENRSRRRAIRIAEKKPPKERRSSRRGDDDRSLPQG